MQYSTTLRNATLTAISTTVGAGGTLKVWTGSAPGVGNAATGTLLATLTAVTFGTASGGTISVSATSDSNAAASGTPGYWRLSTSGGTAVVEDTAGVAGGDMSFGSTVAAGGIVTLNSGVLTAGNP